MKDLKKVLVTVVILALGWKLISWVLRLLTDMSMFESMTIAGLGLLVGIAVVERVDRDRP